MNLNGTDGDCSNSATMKYAVHSPPMGGVNAAWNVVFDSLVGVCGNQRIGWRQAFLPGVLTFFVVQ